MQGNALSVNKNIKPEPLIPPKQLVGCLIALGAPPDLVSRDPKKSKVRYLLENPYAGQKRSSIYTRFSLEELRYMVKHYFRESLKECHPDNGGECKSAQIKIPYLKQVYYKALNMLKHRLADREEYRTISTRFENYERRLTHDDAKNIRHLFNTQGMTNGELAELYNVTSSHISRIIDNLAWFDPKYIPPKRRPLRSGPKLTRNHVQAIRRLYRIAAVPRLAQLFDVSERHIYNIVSNQKWAEQ